MNIQWYPGHMTKTRRQLHNACYDPNSARCISPSKSRWAG